MIDKTNKTFSNSYYPLLFFLFVILVLETSWGRIEPSKQTSLFESAKLNKSLYDAINVGDAKAVKSLISNGADINTNYKGQ